MMADHQHARIARLSEPFKVVPGSEVRLQTDFDPRAKTGVDTTKRGVKLLREAVGALAKYQKRLAAEESHGTPGLPGT